MHYLSTKLYQGLLSNGVLIGRALPDFISQSWRKIGRRPGTITVSRTRNKNIQLLAITLSGVSTGLSAENITGRVLLVVTEVIAALLVWPLMVAIFVLTHCNGNRLYMTYILLWAWYIEPANLYCSVVLCSYLYEFSHNYNELLLTL